MGINIHKSANNHRLFCYKIPKEELKPQNLVYTKEYQCPFYAGLISSIRNNPEILGSKLQTQYDTFTIETYDNVDEISEGDRIYITNFDKPFIVQTKETVLLRKGLTFASVANMPKAVRFELRGKF